MYQVTRMHFRMFFCTYKCFITSHLADGIYTSQAWYIEKFTTHGLSSETWYIKNLFSQLKIHSPTEYIFDYEKKFKSFLNRYDENYWNICPTQGIKTLQTK